MVRRSVVLIVTLCASGMAFAQTHAPPGAQAGWQARPPRWEQMRVQMEQKRMDRLAVLLDMTSTQKQQVQAIFSAERSQVKQAMKQARAAREAARTDAKAKLGQVLSPNQMKKLDLLMPKGHHRFCMMREPMGMHGPMGMWHHPGGSGLPPPPEPGPQ